MANSSGESREITDNSDLLDKTSKKMSLLSLILLINKNSRNKFSTIPNHTYELLIGGLSFVEIDA